LTDKNHFLENENSLMKKETTQLAASVAKLTDNIQANLKTIQELKENISNISTQS